MKNLFFAATAALVLLCSCSKENDNLIDNATGGVVEVSFVEEQPETRAFFGTTAAAETWEKSLSSVTLFVFKSSGELITQRSFSSSELTAKSAKFALPGVAAGDNCEFYAVANTSLSGVTSKTTLLLQLESSAGSYNGTFAEVNTAAKRSGGFVMSGNTTKAIAAAGASTSVAVTLKRTVAKVAVQVTQGAGFGSIYTGAVKVNSIAISKAASQSPIIKPATATPGTMNYTFTQTSGVSGSNYQNLFYLFENGALSAGSRVMLTINATYDKDGNFSTTTDQTPMTYQVELTGDSAGAISRNGYYRVAVTINGLSGSSATLSITVADWETPITQSVSIGS